MEDIQFYMLCTILVVATGLFTGLWTMIGRHLADRRVKILEADMESVIMTLRSRQGEAARADKKQEQAEFMANAAVIMKGEGEMADKIQKVIALNPEMALKMASKLGLPKLL